jgi:hypothetical protein
MYNCPNTENIGSIKFISGEAAILLTRYFSVLGQLKTYTVTKIVGSGHVGVSMFIIVIKLIILIALVTNL